MGTYAFHAQWRRIKKTVTNAGGLGETKYIVWNESVVSVNHPMKELLVFVAHGDRCASETAASGRAALTPASGRLRGPQGPSATRAPRGANYSCLGLTNKAGIEVEKYAYTPHGQVHANRTSSRGDFDDDRRLAPAYHETGGCPWLLDDAMCALLNRPARANSSLGQNLLLVNQILLTPV